MENAGDQPGHKQVHFVPGELIVVLDHSAGQLPDNALDVIDKLIDEATAEDFRGLANQMKANRLNTIVKRLFSLPTLLAALAEFFRSPLLMLRRILIFCNLQRRINRLIAHDAKQIGVNLREANNRIRRGEGSPVLTVNSTATNALSLVMLRDLALDDELIAYLSGELTLRALRQSGDGQQVSIAGVIPNWLFAPTPIPSGSGGPGARPVPPASTNGITRSNVEIEVDRAQADTLLLSTERINAIPSRPADCHEEVNFLILDTIPPMHQLQEALKQYGATNELIYELLTGLQPAADQSPARSQRLTSIRYFDNRFDPHFDDCSAPSSPQDNPKHAGDIILRDHDYDMSDHGLFIAGLVAANTGENVHIHLIEALNRCGVGTVYSLLWGLQEAFNLIRQDQRLPVVVNLSLMLSLPLRSQHQKLTDPDYAHQVRLYCEAISNEPGVNQSVEEICIGAIKTVIDQLQKTKTEVVVVAAAGNDGENARGSVPARVPAAFESVTGVGALDRQMRVAVYSNEADKPLNAGYDIFGGEQDNTIQSHKMADSKKGILSVYTASQFPGESAGKTGTPNASGWARWAGTSFAAPLLGTILAWERTCGQSYKITLDKLQNILIEKPPDSHRLPYKQK